MRPAYERTRFQRSSFAVNLNPKIARPAATMRPIELTHFGIDESATKGRPMRGNRLCLFRVISPSGALREKNQPTEAMESSRGEPRIMPPGLSQFPSSAPAVPYGTRPRMSRYPNRRRHDPAYP